VNRAVAGGAVGELSRFPKNSYGPTEAEKADGAETKFIFLAVKAKRV
jgi:hypothetical protein